MKRSLPAHVAPQWPDAPGPCKIALIVEAPAIDDLCEGRPLAGYKGKLLNKALRLANINRRDLFIGYIFDYRIPADDIKLLGLRKWHSFDYYQDAPRKMPGVGFLPCLWDASERLATELTKARPAVIMPMGTTALWAFTGQTSIRKSRGAADRAREIVPGAKIIPTFDAGYIHRQYKMFGTWVNDFKRAWQEAAGDPDVLTRSPRELWLAPTLADMEEFYERYLVAADCITVDIETAKGQITDIAFGCSAERAISLPFVDYRQPSRSYWSTVAEELAAWDYVERVLALPNAKQFQNGPYDCFYLVRYGFRVNNWRKDLRLLHHALYPELPKDLAYMTSTYAYEGPWKLLGDHARSDEAIDRKRDE